MWRAIPVFLVFLSLGAAAQDGDSGSNADAAAEYDADLDFDHEPERCIRTQSIRRTKIIDDRTIAFYMRGRDVYINSLPRECPQLAREERFAYESRAGQLCSSDFITVLLQYTGRFERGFTCKLGEFVPTNAETVDIMIQAVEERGVTPPARGEAVELPAEEEAEAEQ